MIEERPFVHVLHAQTVFLRSFTDPASLRLNRLPAHGSPIALQLEEVWLAQCPGGVIPQLPGIFAAWYKVYNGAVEAHIKSFDGNGWYSKCSISLHRLFVVGQHILERALISQRGIHH